MSVLLDTGVLFAFLNRQDKHHDRARDLLSAVAHQRFGVPIVTDWAVDELFTLIRSRLGDARVEEAAHRLVVARAPLIPRLEIIEIGRAALEPVWKAFAKHRDLRLSFTDAAQLHAMAAHGIDHLATFDGRLAALAPSRV